MKRAEHECAAETASLDTWVATSSRDPFATHLPEGDCIAVCLTGAATAPAVYLTAGRAFLYCPEIHQTRCHASGSIALSVGSDVERVCIRGPQPCRGLLSQLEGGGSG